MAWPHFLDTLLDLRKSLLSSMASFLVGFITFEQVITLLLKTSACCNKCKLLVLRLVKAYPNFDFCKVQFQLNHHLLTK